MKRIIDKFFQFILLSLVWIYRTLISPLVPPICRFVPSCSRYALDAIQQQGAWKGLLLTIRRLAKCHPWGGHGLDMAPEKKTNCRETK